MGSYKYYVAYSYPGGTGSVFMNTNIRYNTTTSLEALIEYISKNHCFGGTVIILNLIELEREENKSAEL